ncbi:MAG TPA: hypothetical protein PK643_00365 [Saprospiraceae bacterium]|nr:hypothetical protein [Saprospiraceae bacterium]
MAVNEEQRFDQLEKEARAWAQLTRKKMIFRLNELGLSNTIAISQEEKPLRKSIGYKLKKQYGDLSSIGFSFSRHGIFLEHGVGKNRPVGSPAAEAAKRPWLRVVLPGQIEELANILAEQYADIAAQEARILIPGVIDTTISS